MPLLTHHGGTYLTQTYTMAPALSFENELVAILLNIESRTVEMALAQGATYLKFLTDGEGFLATYDLEFPDASALAALHGDEVENLAEINLEFAIDELGDFGLGITYFPTVEVGCLLVEVVKYLAQDMLIVGVAIWILERYQIGLWRVFPAVLELLSHTTTAFREACITNLRVVHQYLSTGLTDSFFNVGVVGAGDALIALTVIVGTYIEDGMIFTVVPADKLVVALGELEEIVASTLMLLALLHLCQQPRTGDDCVGLEEL